MHLYMDALLRAHAYLRIERPPLLWQADADDSTFFGLLGEMIAAGLARNGNRLGELTLNIANVTVPPDAEASNSEIGPPVGDFVAFTIRSAGDWTPESSWLPRQSRGAVLVNVDLTRAARRAGAYFGYSRAQPGEGSVTVWFPRVTAAG